MDKLSQASRSENMRRIRSTGMKPELAVRSIAHRMGYRFRLHAKDLPGKPDLVFRSRRKVIFVDGCFWHGHDCKEGRRVPKSNVEYWLKKIARNKQRDAEARTMLEATGWRVLVIWECERREQVRDKLRSFLGTERRQSTKQPRAGNDK